LGFLYDGYDKDAWWFELVDMTHKFLLTSVLSFFPSTAQMPVGMVVCTLYTMAILVRKPYYRKGDDRLHMFAQVELFLLMLAGFVFFREGVTDSQVKLISAFLIIVTVCFMVLFILQAANIIRKLLQRAVAGEEDTAQALGLENLDAKGRARAEQALRTLEKLTGKKQKGAKQASQRMKEMELQQVKRKVILQHGRSSRSDLDASSNEHKKGEEYSQLASPKAVQAAQAKRDSTSAAIGTESVNVAVTANAAPTASAPDAAVVFGASGPLVVDGDVAPIVLDADSDVMIIQADD